MENILTWLKSAPIEVCLLCNRGGLHDYKSIYSDMNASISDASTCISSKRRLASYCYYTTRHVYSERACTQLNTIFTFNNSEEKYSLSACKHDDCVPSLHFASTCFSWPDNEFKHRSHVTECVHAACLMNTEVLANFSFCISFTKERNCLFTCAKFLQRKKQIQQDTELLFLFLQSQSFSKDSRWWNVFLHFSLELCGDKFRVSTLLP